jgi:hypothetical protein
VDSRSNVYLRLVGIGLALALAGCDRIPFQATVAPPPTPVPDLGEAPSSPVPIASPTPTPAPLRVFPLAADLYYLDNEGLIWLQPQSGDEHAAQVISRPDRAVRDFAVGPGGDWVLYRTDEFIATQSVDGLSGQLVAEGVSLPPDITRGDTLVWSSDAGKIAYTTDDGFQVYIPGVGEFGTAQIFDAPEGQIVHLAWSPDGVWLAAVRAEGSAVLYRVDTGGPRLHAELGGVGGLTWLSDGRLAFAPVEGGLAALPPDRLEERVFLVPQSETVSLPAQRPDGILVFLLHPDGPGTPGYLGVATEDAYQQPGQAPIDAPGLRWTPDATYLLSLEAGRAAVIDPLGGASGELETGGPATDADWGPLLPPAVTGMAMPSALYFLAPVGGVFQVWKLPADKSAPTPLTRAADDVLGFDVTRGGARLAYTTVEGVYVAQPGVEEPTLIAQAQPDAPGPPGGPDFSPDGGQLAYDNAGLWVVDLATGVPRQIVADLIPTTPETELKVTIYREPRWSPDGAWLLASVSFYEGSGWALFTADGDGPYMLQPPGSHARWTDDGWVTIFDEGGGYSPAGLSLIEPGQQPVASQVLDLPVTDARLGPGGELRFLGIPTPFGLGPVVTRLYTANPDGSQVKPISVPFVLNEPVLSPDGHLSAGSVTATYAGSLPIRRLVIVEPESGQAFTIDGVEDVHALAWDE